MGDLDCYFGLSCWSGGGSMNICQDFCVFDCIFKGSCVLDGCGGFCYEDQCIGSGWSCY